MLASASHASLPMDVPMTDPNARVRDAAKSALRASGYPDVAKLRCEVTKGVVVLSGFVSSYYLKQVAQEAILRLNLSCGVENGVVVQRV